jgi:hypothetical protein
MRLLWLLLVVTACSPSPLNPVNQTPLIRGLDSFFSGGRTDGETPPQGQRQNAISPILQGGE